MAKQIAHITGLILIVAVATFIVTQRNAEVKLREHIQSLGEQRKQLSEVTAENTRLSNLVVQTALFASARMAPPIELLRLRSEVTRLRRNYGEVEELRNEIENLRGEIRVVGGPTLNETYAMSGVATNGLPEIEMHATKEAVLSELRRTEAKVLREDDNFIYAEAFPVLLSRTNSDPLTITMALWFEDGKLTTRIDNYKLE
ncbi:MAG: hypothetical protein V9H26_01585 [Verrucomicrobiota bacterium]|nr:hypothetical protein [Verrucomicrobiota bacterium]MCC6819865.1 hypothetical protein [Limisphaerales bacterium]